MPEAIAATAVGHWNKVIRMARISCNAAASLGSAAEKFDPKARLFTAGYYSVVVCTALLSCL